MSTQDVIEAKLLPKASGDAGVYALDFTRLLPSGVTISSISAASVDGDDNDLSVTGAEPNSSEYTDPYTSTTYAAGIVALYTMSGGTAGKTYEVRIKAVFSNGWVKEGIQPVKVK